LSDRAQIDRMLPWAAAIVWLATVARAVIASVAALRHDQLLPGGASLSLLIAVSAVVTAGVGAVIAGRTGNVVGWLMEAAGLELAFGVGAAISVIGPCGTVAADTVWLAVLGGAAWWAFLWTSAALFPSGRPGRGPTALVGIVGTVVLWAGMVTTTVGAALDAGSALDAFGVHDACPTSIAMTATIRTGAALMGIGALAVLVATIRRAARAGGETRAQLAPVAAATFAAAVTLGIARLVEPRAAPLSGDAPWIVAAWALAGIGIPLGVAISIVRSRTFGIYRLIGFTADYRLWMIAQAVVAVAAAVVIGWAVTTLLGLDDEPVAVAIVTLMAAAGLYPVWRRRQASVDARFGQRRPDPAAAIASLDLGSIDGDTEPARGPVFDLLRPFAPIVVVEGESGMRFAVRTDDAEIGRHTFVHGGYDLGAMRRAIDLLELEGGVPLWGRTVLDVGANVGVSIVPLLRLFGAEHGIAVEPAPHLQELLRLNLELNDLSERVRVLPIALSDRDGSFELALSPDNAGDHRLLMPEEGTDGTGTRTTVDVPVRRLDGLVDEGTVDASHLGLIWLDVQGHEGHVMAGARELLASSIPIVTEFWPSALERTGGLERFREAVRSSYSRVIDIRAERGGRASDVLRVGDLDELVARYAGPEAFTDLLLLP
jgi:FkbM family methyltransferase